MHKAKYWKNKNGNVKCELCPRKCVIPKDKTGFCNVRKNVDGELHSMVYERPCSINIDPIEKKPFYHFYPGSKVLSVATMGCNFRCKFCCNWDISQAKIEKTYPEKVPPKKIVEIAKQNDIDLIAYTYTEPTIFFEYAEDIAKIAKKENLKNIFVTNGYAMEKPLNSIKKNLDAVVIDFKGNNKEFYEKFSMAKLEEVKNGALLYKKLGIHIEVTNLVIPDKNDDLNEMRELSRWIKKNLGKNTPFHLLRFFPTPEMPSPKQTKFSTLKKIYEIAKEEGLNYVYIGNTENPEYNNTYCPNCNELLIERFLMNTTKINLTNDNKCERCNEKINLVR